jgi:hypothetical protein
MTVVDSFQDPTMKENDINITSVTSVGSRRLLLSNQFDLMSYSTSVWLERTTGVIVDYIVTFTVNSISDDEVLTKYNELKANLEAAILSNNFTMSLRQNAIILGVTGLETVEASALPTFSDTEVNSIVHCHTLCLG